MKLEDLKGKIEIDVEGSLARFAGMESMYIKFLKKLPEDENYQKLKEAVDGQDNEEIEVSAHTLKGISGNLGLTGIYDKSSRIVSAVREHREQEIPGLMEELSAEMEKACELIRAL
ncbi:MAG TPA: Hpt domain-containing protein [Candidatus Blautia merdavium]|uniref:Hpt domain-containing protein n=1 Tax=Candidatus Blautia merdavium TaxID=2838494 RepID=A0A9D2TDI9_9FIRM|nr:Hpt domain-containing protein [Candidatus Blautia merdavium]